MKRQESLTAATRPRRRGSRHARSSDAPVNPSGRQRPSARLGPRRGPRPVARHPTTLERHRSFDPEVVGTLEGAAWVAYYRREWLRFGRAAVTLARRTFGLSWPATIASSWLVLRANQLWAPFPDNSPERAQRAMERFFGIVQRQSGESFDPAVAAALEVQWWRVHRDMHHTSMTDGEHALTEAIATLYAYVYRVPTASVRAAAKHRVSAMRHTDRWVRSGCGLDSPVIDEARAALIRSYIALLAAVQTPHPDRGARHPGRNNPDGSFASPPVAGESSARQRWATSGERPRRSRAASPGASVGAAVRGHRGNRRGRSRSNWTAGAPRSRS